MAKQKIAGNGKNEVCVGASYRARGKYFDFSEGCESVDSLVWLDCPRWKSQNPQSISLPFKNLKPKGSKKEEARGWGAIGKKRED